MLGAMPRILARACAALGVLTLIAACDSGVELPQPRLVLLYAPCTVNKQYLSPYNQEIAFTPFLKVFAEDSVVFLRHQTEAGQSGIAYASIFSGTQADRHGAYRHPVRLEDDLYLIAEAYADAGYETFFWNAHPAASGRLNYAQGVPRRNTIGRPLKAENPRFLRILEKLQRDETYKAFVMTNFTVTHGPYHTRPLERFRARYPEEGRAISDEDAAHYTPLYSVNHHALSWNFPKSVETLQLSEQDREKLVGVVELLYAANVRSLDQLFGQVLLAIDSRGLRDQSLIAFTADHGEDLYRDHALFKWSHAMQLAPDALGVPFLIRAPGLEPRRYEGVTRSMDVFPTLAGLSGIPLPDAAVRGRDLAAALGDHQPPPDLVAPSHTTVLVRSVFQAMHNPARQENWALARGFFPDEDVAHIWVSMREGDVVYKLRNLDGQEWGYQVFDLAVDPEERTNLYDPADPKHTEMASALTDYKARLVKAYPLSTDGARERLLPEAEEAEMMRELGYIR